MRREVGAAGDDRSADVRGPARADPPLEEAAEVHGQRLAEEYRGVNAEGGVLRHGGIELDEVGGLLSFISRGSGNRGMRNRGGGGSDCAEGTISFENRSSSPPTYHVRGDVAPHHLDPQDEMEDGPAHEGQYGIDVPFVGRHFYSNGLYRSRATDDRSLPPLSSELTPLRSPVEMCRPAPRRKIPGRWGALLGRRRDDGGEVKG